MDYWTSHHFSGKRDEEGKFKGKGELQLQMQVQQNGDDGGFIENLRQKLCVTFKWEHEESESESKALLPFQMAGTQVEGRARIGSNEGFCIKENSFMSIR